MLVGSHLRSVCRNGRLGETVGKHWMRSCESRPPTDFGGFKVQATPGRSFQHNVIKGPRG